ncbi:MAG TPA: TonB-dependent receptor [Prolixibacteraceae bacterium]|nr:TonB-dependent receptor [Prolixibacteraceae bacterium]
MKKSLHATSFRRGKDFLLKCELLTLFLLIGIFHANAGFFSQSIPAQEEIKVSGTITENTGSPLPGVNIVIEGTTRGITSDVNGRYEIMADSNAKLHFSFIGMIDQIVEINGRTTINIVLKETSEELEDIVVVGFGKQKKESVLSAIETIDVDDLRMPSSNLTTAFAGRMAGVISYQTNGEPGQDQAQFFIRGVTSFGAAAKKDPLILIDNVELTSNDLARLNPDDIQSFSILKDATATSLYGARGANGVILVMTKQGSEGPAKLNIRYENSISQPTRELQTADAISFMRLNNEAVRTRNPEGALPYGDKKIAETINGTNPYAYPSVDWKNLLTKNNANNQRLNFNLTGGGKVVQYYLAGGVSQDNGILKVDNKNNFNNNIDLKKYSIRSNVNIALTKTTDLIVRMSGTFDDYTGPRTGGSTVYQNAIRANPVMFPAYFEPDEANKFTEHILFGNAGTTTNEYLNPYADLVSGYKDSKQSTLMAQMELNQKLDVITEGLNFRIMANTTRYSFFDVNRAYNPFYYQVGLYNKPADTYQLVALNPLTGTEYLNYVPGTKDINSSVYMESAINYNRKFSEKYGVSGMLVFTMREYLFANAADLQTSLPQRNIGLAGRYTFDYLNKYFIEANFGYNGSERFDVNHRWGFFPSIGLGWIISNEPFWERTKSVVNNLKLRGTYGLVGNDAIGSASQRFFYLSDVNLNDGSKAYNFGTNYTYTAAGGGVTINKYADPNIGWETAYKTNLGIELGLFDKLEVIADFFKEKRTNILQDRTNIPSTMGLSAIPTANIGKALSKGIDISVKYQQFFNKDFWMQGQGTFTYATSEYLQYEEPNYENQPWRSKIGYSVNQQWGYVAERLFVDDNEVQNSPIQQFGEYLGGDIKYKDISGDGKIDVADMVPIGFPTMPEIIYGFGLSTGYKKFDFSVFFQGSARSSFWLDAVALNPFANTVSGGGKGNNAVAKFIEESHWSEESQNIYATWPRLSTEAILNNQQVNTWFMRDGSFLRLKSLEFGYTIPSEKLKLSRLRVYFSGTNLLTFSKFKLWDVEMGGNGLGYPIQKTFNLGIQIEF